ncbi:hypothetical protein HJC99_06605 [Candidatus Saccharibacteria bacterium]|nr:hypothetical protein [Candidatus Saccharibacteria bacterium]
MLLSKREDWRQLRGLVGGMAVHYWYEQTAVGELLRVEIKDGTLTIWTAWRVVTTGSNDDGPDRWGDVLIGPVKFFDYELDWGSALLGEDGSVNVTVRDMGMVTLYPLGHDPYDRTMMLALAPVLD